VIQHPLLWECETTAPVAQDGLKVGVKSCTTIKTIPLPKITRQQKIKFAILCAKQVCKNKKWNTWADTWLSGKDRSKAAAVAADAAHAAHAAAYATVAAAAANAAHAAAVAAYATAVAAAHAAHKIDFISLALLAVKD
jgi:CTP synthase (UTP-ammonia lyase)